MFNIGGGEILVIAIIALIAVGPDQLPSVMRRVGGFVSQVRSMTAGLRDEFMAGVDQADPNNWMGDGSADKPIVPHGYAENTIGKDLNDDRPKRADATKHSNDPDEVVLAEPMTPSAGAATGPDPVVETSANGSGETGAAENSDGENGAEADPVDVAEVGDPTERPATDAE